MVRNLEKVAEAGKRFVLGASVLTYLLAVSPEKAEGQTKEYCEDEKGEGLPRITYNDGFYHINYVVETRSKGFYIEDDLVFSVVGDCINVSFSNAKKETRNGEPAFLERSSGSFRSDNAHNSNRNQSFGGAIIEGATRGLIEGAIEGIFGNSKDKSETQGKGSRLKVDLDDARRVSERESRERDYSSRYGNGPGSWSSDGSDSSAPGSSNEYSASWGSQNEQGNVRNSQGERTNKPEGPSKEVDRNNSYEVDYNYNERDRKAKEFFGGYDISYNKEWQKYIGTKFRTASYNLLKWSSLDKPVGAGIRIYQSKDPGREVYEMELDEAEKKYGEGLSLEREVFGDDAYNSLKKLNEKNQSNKLSKILYNNW